MKAMQGESLEIVDFARDLVLSCGWRLRKKRACAPMEVKEKNGYSDIVTDHDLWMQRILAETIAQRYPTHSMIAEEGLARENFSPWTWIIDPIDGTTNYVNHGAAYAISVALYFEGKPYYGLVLDVAGKRLYEAPFEGELTAQPAISATEQNILHISHKTIRYLMRQGADPLAFCDRFQGVRYMGCASLELCGLSEAKAGLYVSSQLKLWDFAAAACVLSAAGCHLWAAPIHGENYFVMASRSEALLQNCLHAFPLPVKQLFQENGGRFYAAN